MTRRELLAVAVALGVGRATGIDPIARPKVPKIQLALAAYSFRKALDLKKPTMTIFEFIDLAATMPLDAVELTSYFLAETNDAYLAKVKAHAAAKKLAISGMPIRSTFTMKDDAKRAAEVVQVKEWIPRAAKLGAPTVRIFAGAMEKGDDIDACRARVVAAIDECCIAAKEHGVKLALENHHGITGDAESLIALAKAVKSDAFGLNIDTGNFKTADPYADIAKIVPYGVVCQLKTEVFPGGGKAIEADLPRVIKILKDGKYDGAVALEFEAAGDPKTEVPKYVKQLRQLIDQ